MHDLGLREYLQIIRRRKWIVLQALIIVPLAAVAFSLRQASVYQASADVLLRDQTLPSTLAGISASNPYAYSSSPYTSIYTSLQVAGLPALAHRVQTALRKQGISSRGSLGVAEVGTTNVIRFTSTAGDPAIAAATATTYARQFTIYNQQLDTSSITKAIAGLEKRITSLRATGTRQSRSEASALQAKVGQLQTLQALQTSSAVVVRQAAGAAKIRPTPKKYGVLGLGLGLLLGIGLAFLRDAFDTKLRSAHHIGALLKMPSLGRVPPPPRRLERDKQLVMLADPTSAQADAFRRLRMNLEFVSIGKPSQVTLFTSALAEEGKSTTLANLGIAMALAGKSVALVDLDLHRPMLSKFFRLDDSQPGISSVVLGLADLDEALVPVRPDTHLSELEQRARNGHRVNGNRPVGAPGSEAGTLLVLPTGVLPPDPGEFVGLESVRHIVAALRDRVDVVLIDAPPLLAVGDGLTIAGFADAMVTVVRSDLARRPATGELGAMLARLPAAKLGFVLCGEAGLDGKPYYAYGRYGYDFVEPHEEEAFR